MKKILSVVLIIAVTALTLVGCGGTKSEKTGEPSTEKIVLKASHVMAKDSSFDQALNKFKELVEAESNGQIEVQVFADAVLGGEKESLEGMQAGTIDVAISTTSPLASFVPEMGVLDLPFLFKSTEHAMAVLNGPIGETFKEKITSIGIIPLAFADFGFRHLTNNIRPVYTPADVKGLKIRVMQNPVQIETWKELGAEAVPMSISELLNALQTGVVDGQENPITATKNNGAYQAQKYISKTGHSYSAILIGISKVTYDKLTPEQQDIVSRAGIAAAELNNKLYSEIEQSDIKFLEEKGLVFNEVDHQAFVDAVKPIYVKYEPTFGKDVIDQIKNTDI